MGSQRFFSKCVVIMAVAGLSLASAACGGEETDAGAEAGKTDSRAREVGWAHALRQAAADALKPKRLDDRDQLVETLHDIQLNFAADYRYVVCGRLTKTGQRELAQLGGQLTFQGCKNTIAAASGRRRKTGTKTAISGVLSVTISRHHAVARVQDPDGRTRLVPFVREGPTGWAMPSFNYVDPSAIVAPPLGPGHDSGDPPGVGARRVIEEAIYDVQAEFPRGDGSAVCEELTQSGQREVEVSVGTGSCAEGIAHLARKAVRNGFQPRVSAILDVDVIGERATALLRDHGDPGKPAYRVPVSRENGAWQLPSLTLVEPIDLESPRRGRRIPIDFGDPRNPDAKGAIREILTDAQADFATGLPTLLCSDLSSAGERELLALARPGRRSCQNVVFDIATWNKRAGIPARFSRILSIRIDGPRATARLADPPKPAYDVPFVKSRGHWQLASLARIEPIADAMAHLRRLRAIRAGGG